MQKAINLEPTGNTIARVLSIADATAAEASPNGLDYIVIEDYTEPPVLETHMDIAYPMYNKVEAAFFWAVVNYQTTATDLVLANHELSAKVGALEHDLARKEAEIQALATQQAFAEDCLIELGQAVYA